MGSPFDDLGVDAAPLQSQGDADVVPVTDDVTHIDHVVGAIDNSANLASIESPPMVATTGDLYLVVVSVKPSRAISEVSGFGSTWERVREQCGGRDTARVAMLWTMAKSDGPPEPITATLNGGAPFVGSAVIAVHRYRGADPIAPLGKVTSANTNGSDAAALCSGGDDTDNYRLSIDTAAASTVFVGTHTASYRHSPGGDYVERSDTQSGDLANSAGVAVEDREFANQTAGASIIGDFGNSAPDWAVIAVEILHP